MKILQAIYFKTLLLDILLLIVFSCIISYISTILPDKFYRYKAWLYSTKRWENNGEVYQRVFKVNLWKHRVPELGDFVKSIFPKKHLKSFDREYLIDYLKESCKAELAHWGIIASSLFFMIWSDFLAFCFMFILTFIINIPFIIIQRYNRPRIIHFMEQLAN